MVHEPIFYNIVYGVRAQPRAKALGGWPPRLTVHTPSPGLKGRRIPAESMDLGKGCVAPSGPNLRKRNTKTGASG
jgi:hypothetical protein